MLTWSKEHIEGFAALEHDRGFASVIDGLKDNLARLDKLNRRLTGDALAHSQGASQALEEILAEAAGAQEHLETRGAREASGKAGYPT